jgi:hypothetical protein
MTDAQLHIAMALQWGAFATITVMAWRALRR